MDEGRKRTPLIGACILAAPKLAQWDGRPSPALENSIADAITLAEKIKQKIDVRWPTESVKELHRGANVAFDFAMRRLFPRWTCRFVLSSSPNPTSGANTLCEGGPVSWAKT